MATTARTRTATRDKVRKHRQRRRKAGMRLVQMWVPDTRTKEFAREAHRQSLLIAQSEQEAEDQAFVDSISVWNDDAFWNSVPEWTDE